MDEEEEEEKEEKNTNEIVPLIKSSLNFLIFLVRVW